MDLTAARRKLHCVIYQVPKDLLQPRRIRSKMDFSRTEIERTHQMFSVDFRLTNLESILQYRLGINDFKIELKFASIYASQIKQIVDKPRLEFHIAANHVQRFMNTIRQALLTVERDCRGQYRRKGRAQFMAKHG